MRDGSQTARRTVGRSMSLATILGVTVAAGAAYQAGPAGVRGGI